MSKDQIGQHKKLAMGKPTGNGPNGPNGKFAKGGPVLKTGIPESPITKAKIANGVPGIKKGGKAR
jgi:hypothetical protein